MADISKEELKKEIAAILKDADLSSITAKKVRQQLEKKLDCDLVSRREEIDQLAMSYVNSRKKEKGGSDNGEDGTEEESEEEDEESEEENDKKKSKNAKRPAPPAKKPAKKSKKASSDEEDGSASEGEESDDYKPKKAPPKKKAAGKKKKGSESDSDSDWGKGGKKKGGGGGGKGKGSGYTRAYKLSPALAELMGQESMPRHEVVRRVWALIKERNLYDQNNRQFAICDEDLFKVIGIKRFRTFGMMKYLKTHFHE